MRGRKLPEADEGKKSPLCYEADDRLTPDEQGPEADEGKERALRADKGKKAPVSVA